MQMETWQEEKLVVRGKSTPFNGYLEKKTGPYTRVMRVLIYNLSTQN